MLKVVGASWDQTRVSTMILGAVAILGIVAFIIGEVERAVDDGVYAATVHWDDVAGYRIEFWGQGNNLDEIETAVARAYLKPDIDNSGWSMLEVQSDGVYSDKVQAFAAGLVEGSLSWQLIYWQWKNTVQEACEGREVYCQRVKRFLAENDQWVRDTAEQRGVDNSFWHQVDLFYRQLDGIEYGWHHGAMRSGHEEEIPHEDFLWMNIVSDLADLEQKFNGSFSETQSPLAVSAAASLSSAFVKLIPKSKEIFVAHNSAGLYRSMLKMLKCYQLNFHQTGGEGSALVPGRAMVFSSYPGSIHSQDDFYHVSGGDKHNILVTGSAVHNYNLTTWDRLDPHQMVLAGPRVLAANRLATSGRSWGMTLSTGVGGTGNKQWLVVDPSRLTSETKKGLLWVVEQMPGQMHSSDHSHVMWGAGFWANHGLPFHKDILKASGTLAMEKRFGPIFSSSDSPLTHIFHRDQVNATDLSSVRNLMRSNEFLEDALSHGSPLQAIAGRGDLPGMAKNFLHPVLRPLGTTDCKVLRYHSGQFQLQVVAGPTFGNVANSTGQKLPPFKWSASHFESESHRGQPDLWDFNPINPSWFWK